MEQFNDMKINVKMDDELIQVAGSQFVDMMKQADFYGVTGQTIPYRLTTIIPEVVEAMKQGEEATLYSETFDYQYKAVVAKDE